MSESKNESQSEYDFNRDVAIGIVDIIADEVNNRSGIGWEMLDQETENEMREVMVDKVYELLGQAFK